ncbi:hypothetical protein ACH429_21895 [Streptomyces pathocidini]|uniref:Uncharacterized protein n=1 Tax=Streptomyces pathocidini TaxID=1650571 RepID=A0ABW7UVW4_9ACTN
MRRHEFQPGRLIAGLTLLGTGVVYALDATNAWPIPSWAPLPALAGGLLLAAITGTLAVARHRARRPDGDPTAD